MQEENFSGFGKYMYWKERILWWIGVESRNSCNTTELLGVFLIIILPRFVQWLCLYQKYFILFTNIVLSIVYNA